MDRTVIMEMYWNILKRHFYFRHIRYVTYRMSHTLYKLYCLTHTVLFTEGATRYNFSIDWLYSLMNSYLFSMSSSQQFQIFIRSIIPRGVGYTMDKTVFRITTVYPRQYTMDKTVFRITTVYPRHMSHVPYQREVSVLCQHEIEWFGSSSLTITWTSGLKCHNGSEILNFF